MITVNVSYDVPENKIPEIEQIVRTEILNNPNFSGYRFEVKRNDHTWIHGVDGYDGAYLMNLVFSAIQGLNEVEGLDHEKHSKK